MLQLIRLHSLLCAWWLSAAALADETISLIPMGGITDNTPSLETAYPNEVYISRRPEAAGGIVHYEVRVYAPEAISHVTTLWAVAIVVCDRTGTPLVSAMLDVSGESHIPPSTEKFRSFFFSVHESLEPTTAINIGRHSGLRVYFTKYRLPLKTIDHPKAHR